MKKKFKTVEIYLRFFFFERDGMHFMVQCRKRRNPFDGRVYYGVFFVFIFGEVKSIKLSRIKSNERP